MPEPSCPNHSRPQNFLSHRRSQQATPPPKCATLHRPPIDDLHPVPHRRSSPFPPPASRSRQMHDLPCRTRSRQPVVPTRLITFAVPEAVDTDGAHNAVNAGSSVDPAEVQNRIHRPRRRPRDRARGPQQIDVHRPRCLRVRRHQIMELRALARRRIPAAAPSQRSFPSRTPRSESLPFPCPSIPWARHSGIPRPGTTTALAA